MTLLLSSSNLSLLIFDYFFCRTPLSYLGMFSHTFTSTTALTFLGFTSIPPENIRKPELIRKGVRQKNNQKINQKLISARWNWRVVESSNSNPNFAVFQIALFGYKRLKFTIACWEEMKRSYYLQSQTELNE